jgi:uncharacterized protein (UPF0276 family)
MRDTVPPSRSNLPGRAGIGYKPQHFSALIADPGAVGWLEVHAENYMGDGGRPLAQLRVLAERFAISVHGVGLSIGGDAALDEEHLNRLAHLVKWLNPAEVSEHLAWSTHGAEFLNDLLPVPYTTARLARIAEHIDRVQTRLGRRILLENPSVYLDFAESTWAETAFLDEIARRSGCGLLLDVNNVHVSSTNRHGDADAYLAAFPMARIGEIHLGGHDVQTDETGAPLLIDSHDRDVADPVWGLYRGVIAREGPLPTLIEWDNDVPGWPVLEAEAGRAAAILEAAA